MVEASWMSGMRATGKRRRGPLGFGWILGSVEASFLWYRLTMDEDRGDALGFARVPFRNNDCLVDS